MIDTKKMYLCLLNGEMRHTSMLAGTHFDGCEYAHYECAILQLCDEVDNLRAELDAEREKSAEYEYALKKYADNDNWQQRDVYSRYGQYDEWQWCDTSVLPSEIAQDVLEKWAKPEDE